MSSVTQSSTADEAAQFAATVAGVVAQHVQPDPWTPGAAVSDANPALDAALREAGWEELAQDADLLPLAAPAGAALGRAFASLAPIDALLGGALRVGDLVRYARDGVPFVEPRDRELRVMPGASLAPMPYTDSLGVAAVPQETADDHGERAAPERMAAWVAASTGYLAGLSVEALRLAVEHARSRRAFGGPLSALEPVQQMLADAATLVDGLTLLTADRPGMDALAHAGDAAERAVAICMQVTGALGFTMEFPLQRAYRRSRSARAWNDAVLGAWDR